MANAEMLESKYLIGHKRAFEVNSNIRFDNQSAIIFQKEFGYSFYLAGLSLLFICLACLMAILVTTYAFFINPPPTYEDSVRQQYFEEQIQKVWWRRVFNFIESYFSAIAFRYETRFVPRQIEQYLGRRHIDACFRGTLDVSITILYPKMFTFMRNRLEEIRFHTSFQFLITTSLKLSG